MTPLAILTALARSGITLKADGTNLRYRSPTGAATAEMKSLLAEHKAMLLELLAEPQKAAREAWTAAVEEVATAWNALAARSRAGGIEPPWLDEALDQELQAEVAESIRAADLHRAVAAVDRWRAAWLALLAKPTQLADPVDDRGWVEIESDLLGEHVVVALTDDAVPEAEAARPGLVVYGPVEVERLHGTKDENLIRAVHAAKKILGGWVQEPRMADGILAESKGGRPHRNQGVHDVVDAARARLGPRNDTERSITAWLRKHAPPVAALWPEAPIDASWLDWRLHVGPEHLAVLDQAFETVTGQPLLTDVASGGSRPSRPEGDRP